MSGETHRCGPTLFSLKGAAAKCQYFRIILLALETRATDRWNRIRYADGWRERSASENQAKFLRATGGGSGPPVSSPQFGFTVRRHGDPSPLLSPVRWFFLGGLPLIIALIRH